MEKAWQDVLDKFHYGIYLVTVSSAEGPNGMIASWVTQCSHEPPLVAAAIRKSRLAHKQILESGGFGITVLPRESAGLIGRFKIPDWKKKFDSIRYSLSAGGLPVPDDCVGHLDFSLEGTVDVGDHTLFIGRIQSGAPGRAAGAGTLSTADYRGVYRGSQ